MKLLEVIQLLVILCISRVVEEVEGRQGTGKEHHHHHHRIHNHHIHHYRHGATLERCSKCLPGQFAFSHCAGENDTLCQDCPSGTYSPHHTYRHNCFVCSRCGEGLYVARECVPTRDTVCDSCLTYRGPHNRDYKLKCLGLKPEEVVTELTKSRTSVTRKSAKLSNKSNSKVLDIVDKSSLNSIVMMEELPETAGKLVSHVSHPQNHSSIITERHDAKEEEASVKQVVSTLTISAICSCLLFLTILVISITFRWCCWKRKIVGGQKYTAVETVEIVPL